MLKDGLDVVFIIACQKGPEPLNLGPGSGAGESLKPLVANLQVRHAKNHGYQFDSGQ